jgi:hypothetical protein
MSTRMHDLLTLTARGQLLHHFHGDYSATVLIVFDSPEDAALAHARLPQADKWKPGRDAKALIWRGGREALDTLKASLHVEITPCGFSHCRTQCKHAEIDGVPHSIDSGPVFRLSIRTPHPSQESFPI